MHTWHILIACHFFGIRDCIVSIYRLIFSSQRQKRRNDRENADKYWNGELA